MLQIFESCEIQLLMVVAMAGPLLALTTNSPPPLKDRSFTRLPPNDVLFTEDVLLEVSARSRIDCSKKCVETEGCVMCTFLSSPQGPPGHCRLHSQLQNSNDTKKSMPGAKSVARRFRCDEDYKLSCGRCLIAVDKREKYTSVREKCNKMGADLVMPKSREAVECVWTFKNSRGLNTIWVGADDLETDNAFQWNDGTLLPVKSSLWRSQEGDPEMQYKKNCANLRDKKSNLYDSDCYDHYQYVCQKLV